MLFALLLASCGNGDDMLGDGIRIPGDDEWIDTPMDGASATIRAFEPGDMVTRSSLAFNMGTQEWVFGWQQGDALGLFPTAKDVEKAETKDGLIDPHDASKTIWRVNPTASQQRRFWCQQPYTNQTVRISNSDPDWQWDDIVRWSAYFAYKSIDPAKNTYENVPFDYTGQTQRGIADISAYKKGSPGEASGKNNSVYRASEAKASAHLGKYDIMISPETAWEEGVRINFQMHHIGAIVRLYLLAPKNENLVITNIKLICDKKIFYEKGTFNLISHPYSSSDKDHGLNISEQVKPDEASKTNMISLDFAGDDAKTIYDASDSYKRYITAYMMLYPITYTSATDGNLFAYVTAYRQGDTDKKEVHFVSNALENKVLEHGCYYQWTSATHLDDGLYPIELTATLLPWQDIVAGSISTDLEK